MLKKVISLLLVLCLLGSSVGCGGGNPVVPPLDEESTKDIIFVQNTNPEDNVLVVAGKDEGEALSVLGEKDAFGNPIKITGAVYTSEQGEAFIIDAGDDGLPTYILDSAGNKVVFANYTDSTVEISIYNSNNELIEGPTTITVDPADLAYLKQLYSSITSKNKDAADVVAFVFKWGGFGLEWAACAIAAISLVVPAIVYACGSAVLSTAAMFIPSDTDDLILSIIGVIQCAFVSKPWEIVACAGSIMSFIGTIIEIINQDNDKVDCFLGYWVNEDPNTGSITKIDIQENNNLLEIYMWGKCHPTDCDWAAMNNPGGPATTTVDDANDGVLNIVWYPDFAIKTQEITYLGGDRLEVYTFTDFYPDDIYGREDYESYDYFIKSD